MSLDPITAILNIIDDVVGGVNSAKKAELAIKLQQLQEQQEADKDQSDTNTEEASNTSLFVAGWRPFIGWVCGFSFFWQFLLLPILLFVGKTIGHSIDAPAFDIATMSTVLMGMLGLGGLRTIEKIQSKK